MSGCGQNPLSFLYIIPIEEGKGEYPFPHQLRENLFQNSVRVKGLFSKKAYKDKHLFAISNASEHGVGKKVIKNVLSIFTFSKENSFHLNGTIVTAPINVIPSNLKFVVVDENFKTVPDFQGWIWTEIFGTPKKNVE